MVMTDARPNTRSTRWTWIAAIWCAGALFDASQTIFTMRAMGARGSWLSPFVIVFVSWLPWMLATPLIVELARRRPIVRGAVLKAGIAHLMAFAIVSMVAEAWSAMLRVISNPWHHNPPPDFVDTWYSLLTDQIVTFVIAYALIGWGSRISRAERLRAVSRDVVTLAGGAAMMLIWAGIVESFLSQYHEPVISYGTKIAFGVVEAGLLTFYLGFVGKKNETAV